MLRCRGGIRECSARHGRDFSRSFQLFLSPRSRASQKASRPLSQMIRLAPTPWEPAPTRYPQPEAPPALRVTHPTRHAPRACRASSFTASSRHTCVVWTRPVYIPKHAHTFVIHSLLPFRFAIPHDTSEPRASLVSVPPSCTAPGAFFLASVLGVCTHRNPGSLSSAPGARTRR